MTAPCSWAGGATFFFQPLARRRSQGTPRSAILQAVQKWEGKADTGSTSYRAVREFRLAVARRALDPIFAPCVEQDSASAGRV